MSFRKLVRYLVVGAKSETFAQHPRNNDICYKEHFGERGIKKFTSKKLIEAIQEHAESRREWLLRKFSYEAQKSGRAINYKLWQDGFHPVILDTLEKIEQRVNYIHYNPVEAEIVFNE